MASYKTPNIGLNKWAETDYFKRIEVNENFDKIDDQFSKVNDKIGILSNVGTFVDAFPIIPPETDDTGRINRAIQAAKTTTKRVFFSGKTYNASNIQWDCTVVLEGMANQTVIKKSVNGPLVTIVGSDPQINGVQMWGVMSNISFDGNKANFTGDGIVGTNPRLFTFINVNIDNCEGSAINLTAPWDCTFIGCKIRSNKIGYRDSATSTQNANNSRFIGCHFEGNEQNHVYSDSSLAGTGGRNLQHYFIGCKFEAQEGTGLNAAIYLDADECQITGCYQYLSQNIPLIYVKGKRNRIVGCTFSTPKESHAIVLDGNSNTIDGCDISTNSTLKEWVWIKSGTANRVQFTATDGGSQKPYLDNGTNTIIDVIRSNDGTRFIRGLKDQEQMNYLHLKQGISWNQTTVWPGNTSVTVSTNQPDTNYNVFVMPSWNTTYWITPGRTTTSFTINFGTPPSSQSTIDWAIVRKG